jgi:hypothetical protein
MPMEHDRNADETDFFEKHLLLGLLFLTFKWGQKKGK